MDTVPTLNDSSICYAENQNRLAKLSRITASPKQDVDHHDEFFVNGIILGWNRSYPINPNTPQTVTAVRQYRYY